MAVGQDFHVGYLELGGIRQRIESNHRVDQPFSPTEIEGGPRWCRHSDTVAQAGLVVPEGVTVQDDACGLVAATPV